MVKQTTRKRANGSTYKVWIIDSWITMPTGDRIRIRRDVPKGKATNRAEALAWAHSYIESLSAAETKSLTAPKLRDFFPVYLTDCESRGNRVNTVAAKQSYFKNWIEPQLGSKRLTDIGSKQLDALRDHMLKKQLSRPMVNAVLILVVNALKFAAERTLIANVPKARLVRGTASTHPPRHLTSAEIDDLLDAASDDDGLTSTILLCADAGLRIGEVRALTWADVDGEAVTVSKSMDARGRVGPTKSGRWRRVKMTSRLRSHLRRVKRTSTETHVVPQTGCTCYQTLRRKMTDVMKVAKLSDKGLFHVLRHSFATRLVRSGTNLRVVKELCGHSALSSTMIYAHVDQDTMGDAIDRLV